MSSDRASKARKREAVLFMTGQEPSSLLPRAAAQPQESATVIILLGLMGGKGVPSGPALRGKKPNCSIAFQ
ncbi:hypothetical protein MPLDJ20_140311 [Mesorhizobium plurifarium]|uniref:Uncharacterized protein n=1 Tax=Mesorhizobium plurifarium TaxID=69974 RepID=A0A090EKW1_MESPL|nr:hypothetical protein MPLDJ20_140311 [Mesorhizobium plurifarium]